MTDQRLSVVIARQSARSDSTGRFDLSVDRAPLGHLAYSLPDTETMTIDYVEVDPSLRGQGMGQQLVAAAVNWARGESRKVIPLCSYARAVMARTAEFHDVLVKR